MNIKQKPISTFINNLMSNSSEEERIEAEDNLQAYFNLVERIFNRLEKEKKEGT